MVGLGLWELGSVVGEVLRVWVLMVKPWVRRGCWKGGGLGYRDITGGRSRQSPLEVWHVKQCRSQE